MKTIRLMSAVVVTAAVCAWSAVAPAQQTRLNVRAGSRVAQEGMIMIFPNYAFQYLKPTADVSGGGSLAR